ncbi:DNA repair protein RecN [bacterium BMS3Bbin04]|nr:DNA repair protein RecN [bacterium BMS3Bbin04]
MSFNPGLSVITGETGAGKSILIGSIALTLGDRAHPDIVREGTAFVEASFSDDNRALKLAREIRKDGRTKARINGVATTITALKEEGRRWLELSAQRDGATLLDQETHLEHIDRFAGLETEIVELAALYHRYQDLKEQLRKLNATILRMKETEELAKYQLAEIEAFAPMADEEQQLEREMRLLEGAELLLQGLGQAVDELDQGAEPISDRLASTIHQISELSRVDDSLRTQESALNDALDVLRQAAMDLGNRRDEVNLDPERLEEIRDRHGQLLRLIRKYGGSMQALLDQWEALKTRENDSDELLRERVKLQHEIQLHLIIWEKVCKRVSQARASICMNMQSEMEMGLRSVGVEKPRFEIHHAEGDGETVEFPGIGLKKVSSTGWDRLEFRISLNPGHEVKPVQHVASGGELSRMMLLLRGLSPPEGLPPVLVFDEIDTGISGKTARQVGLRLKELSRTRQVILVTHLPQIASLADRHLVIEKHSTADSTSVSARELSIGSDEQVDEVARLLGGERISEPSRAAARELIVTAPEALDLFASS